MAKPEWGTKRICQGCATKFYDFGRTPIACPKCGAEFDPEALLKSRKSRPSAPVKAAKPVKPAAKEETEPEEEGLEEDIDLDLNETGEDLEDISESEDDDDAMIEDASELGDDVAKAVVTGNDDDED